MSNPKEETPAAHENECTSLTLELLATQQDVLAISALLPDDEYQLRCRLQANLQIFRHYIREPAQQEELLRGIEKIEYDPNDADLTAFARSIDEIYKKILGEHWIMESNKEIAKAVRYVRNGEEVAVDIVSPNNFYFLPPIERFHSDTFPPHGQIIPGNPAAGRIRKNISIFDPNGIKVFWGDLHKDDTTDLKGTYYILNETDSYHSVPDFAVVIDAQQTSNDPNRPPGALIEHMPSDKPMLEIDYVKARAIYAIVEGRLVPNNTTVSE